MSWLNVRESLETEQSDRQDELRILRNLSRSVEESVVEPLLRAMVVMLYAHYEGFCRKSLEIYVEYVNGQNLCCKEASSAVVAAVFGDLFSLIEKGEKKQREFNSKLPNDTTLHRYARRISFVDGFAEFEERGVKFPDTAVDTESNLWPHVLRRNMYVVGMEYQNFMEHDGQIHFLLNTRNAIAHGGKGEDVGFDDYDRLEQAVFDIMEGVMEVVVHSCRSEVYRRDYSASGAAHPTDTV